MVCGVPGICINTYGTCNLAMVSNMFVSKFPPDISLIIQAPISTQVFATLLLKVSIEIKISGKFFKISSKIWVIRSNSSFSLRSLAPGREE